MPQTTDGESAVETARQLFTEGLQFVEDEDWVNAEERFRRVLALKSSHVVAYNLASALQHLGRVTEASELLRVILRDPSADGATRDAAQQLLSDIEPLIGSITIRVSGETSGAELSLDGRRLELSTLVQTVSVDPGPHRVAVQRDGALIVDREVSVGRGAPLQAEVALELAPRVSPQAVAAQAARRTPAPAMQAPVMRQDQPQRESPSIFARWWFWTGVGTVIAGGVVAALLVPSPDRPEPIAGDTNPPQIHGRVAEMR